MSRCKWYTSNTSKLSLVLPKHDTFHDVLDNSLTQFGHSICDTQRYSNIQSCFERKSNEHVIKTFTYKIYPNKTQISILENWFKMCDLVYNYCVVKFNQDSSQFSTNYMKQKMVIFSSIFPNSKPVPYDILTDVVKQFCTNVKSCFTNLKNRNIKHFKMKYKRNYNKNSILIPKKSINSNGFFPTRFNDIKGFENIDTDLINCDSRLVYNNGNYYLKCPMETETKEPIKNGNIVAIDPGERNFMAFYSTKNAGIIGSNLRERILKYATKINIINRALSRKLNRKKNKLRNVNKLRKRKQNYHDRIKNIVKELHNQTALYLVKNYSKILLPKFETQNMVKSYGRRYISQLCKDLHDRPEELAERKSRINKSRRLSRKQKFVLNSLSHYKFKEHLKHKCKEYNCEFQTVTEEYTSKCCSSCGLLSDKYNYRTKICPYCGYTCDRDINGSRNILLKNHKNNIKTLWCDKNKASGRAFHTGIMSGYNLI